MNRLKKILTGAIMASIMSIIISFQAFAARIAFSDPTVEAGNEVTINMKITAGQGETINSSNVMLVYDPSSLEFVSGTGATGEAGAIRVVGESQAGDSTELTFALTFKALKPGRTTISVSTQEVYDKDGQIVNVSQEGNSTVNITGEIPASGGAALSDLQISPGTLSPVFSPDTENYTAVVGGDVSQITVNAPAADAGANVAISGNENLQIGENEIVCTVTASDGQTKTYRIVVTKTEGEAGGEGSTSIVEQVPFRISARTITVISGREGLEVPEGFVMKEISIDSQPVQGWVLEGVENPEYFIFYAMNENGEEGFYRYDIAERTLQRYFRDSAGGGDFEQKYNTIALDYNSLLKDYEIRFWIIIGLIALAVVLLIVIIVLVAGRNQRDDFIERREAEDDWEIQRSGMHKKMTKEEQYLRDFEEEETEREEDYSFARRVQDNEDRSYVVRGGAYGGQTGLSGGMRGGNVQTRAGESRGNGMGGQTGPTGTRGGVQRNATMGGRGTEFSGGNGGFRGTGPVGNSREGRGNVGGRGTGFSDGVQENRRTIPVGETQAVPVSQIRGSQPSRAASRENFSTGRPGNFNAQRTSGRPKEGTMQEQMDMEIDEDFETIDLE